MCQWSFLAIMAEEWRASPPSYLALLSSWQGLARKFLTPSCATRHHRLVSPLYLRYRSLHTEHLSSIGSAGGQKQWYQAGGWEEDISPAPKSFPQLDERLQVALLLKQELGRKRCRQ